MSIQAFEDPDIPEDPIDMAELLPEDLDEERPEDAVAPDERGID